MKKIKNELKVDQRIKFDWDLYDIYYNTDYEYLGTETRYGVILDYEDNPYEQRMKRDGLLKVSWTHVAEFSNKKVDDILWISKYDKSIVVMNKWRMFKMWLKKHFGYKLILVKM